VNVLVIFLACLVALPALVLGVMNLYQAVTGNRLSKKPSTRSDSAMRRQSAIAGTVLIGCTALLAIMLANVPASV